MSFANMLAIRSALELLLQQNGVSATPADPQQDGSLSITIQISSGSHKELNNVKDMLERFDEFSADMQEDSKLTTITNNSTLPIGTSQGVARTDEDEPWWPYIEEARALPSNEMKGHHASKTDVELLSTFYRSKSARQRAKDISKAFTTKGHFSSDFSYLREFVKDHPPLDRSASRNTTFSAGRSNRNHCRWEKVNGTSVYSGFRKVSSSTKPEAIVMCFTRASSHPPTYGLDGMFIRGEVAAEAWVEVEEFTDVTIASIPRTRVSSLEAVFTQNYEGDFLMSSRVGLREMECILDAAADGQDVDLLSVGFDALSTQSSSLAWIQEKWSHLNIRLVYIVPDRFPAKQVFPPAGNGIRYGCFYLSDVVEVSKGQRTDQDIQQVLDFYEAVNQGKQQTAFNMNLQELTVSRANFRVHPNTETDSGVPPTTTTADGTASGDNELWEVDG